MSQIYLISPEKIEIKSFLPRLEKALNTSLIKKFQLRIKGYENDEFLKIAKEIKKICINHNCKMIINDNFGVALDVLADGIHVGSSDISIEEIKKKSPKNFIIGASCYDSKDLAISAFNQGATYVSFGTFFVSQTKNSQGKPTIEIIKWAKENLNIPVVAIGGINENNCDILAKENTDFIAVISCIWSCKEGEVFAIQRLNDKLNSY